MSIAALSGGSDRSLLLVHGRDFKPSQEVYMDLSLAALRAGIERDYPDCVEKFDVTIKHAAWYGDLNAEVLNTQNKSYDEQLDIGDRQSALASLRELSARKKFGIRYYDRLPGKSAVREAIAGVAAPLLGSIGLSRSLVGMIAPDFARYLDPKSVFAEKVRQRLREKLCELLERDQRVALVTHGTGSVVAYDVLWELSHAAEYKEAYGSRKVDLWMTLGSPLGDSSIRKCLLGASKESESRYPVNVITWHNVSAEDDYTCHDNTLADDFKLMMQQRLISAVNDHKIYNLAVRYGKSNPHSSIGYFIHPRISKILVDWLQSGDLDVAPKYTF